MLEGGVSGKQAFIAVQFRDAGSEPVMVPVSSLDVLNSEEKKQKVIDSAWAFFQRGEFARRSLSPHFVETLASDLAKVVNIQKLVTPLVLSALAELYRNRLRLELEQRGEAAIDSNALHLKADRRAGEDIHVYFDPPQDWEQVARSNIGKLVDDAFSVSPAPFSWYKFAEWLWVNQVAGALGDLEEEIGQDVLAQMPHRDFEQVLLNRIVGHQDSAVHTANLILRRTECLAKMFVSAAEKSLDDLWKFEKLFGLRKLPPDHCADKAGLLVRLDLGRLLSLVAKRPEDLYFLPPRKFEELIAHVFENFGYEVELTPESRDGGYDIFAVRRAELDTRVLIECKRYTPPKKVGRPVIQNLLGVISDRQVGATMGVLATTSTFTRDAEAFIESNRWRVQGQDFNAVVGWISDIVNGVRR